MAAFDRGLWWATATRSSEAVTALLGGAALLLGSLWLLLSWLQLPVPVRRRETLEVSKTNDPTPACDVPTGVQAIYSHTNSIYVNRASGWAST